MTTPLHTDRHDAPRGTSPETTTDVEELLLHLTGDPTPAEHDRLLEVLVRAMMPLADAIARRYSGRGVEVEDLVQVARTALVAAVGRYRPGAGRGFEAFAVPTIHGELKRHFRDNGWMVRPPRRLQELRAELTATEDAMRHRLGREVSDAEVAAELRCSPADVDEARHCVSGYHPRSLDAPSPAGETVGDRIADPDDSFASVEMRVAVGAEVARLTPRDRLIVDLRFGEERTQSEIGEVLGVSQMQVSRLLARILARLRASLSVERAA